MNWRLPLATYLFLEHSSFVLFIQRNENLVNTFWIFSNRKVKSRMCHMMALTLTKFKGKLLSTCGLQVSKFSCGCYISCFALQTNDALVAPLLRLKDNNCHIEESEKVLKKKEKFQWNWSSCMKRKGLHQKGIKFLQKQTSIQDLSYWSTCI